MRTATQAARAVATLCLAALAAHHMPDAAAQVAAPKGGSINTVAVEGTIEAISPPGQLAVKTTDGTTQLFRFLEKVFVHDGHGAHSELSGLDRGMMVVVHYSGTGPSAIVQEVDRIDGNGLFISEGRVTSIDRVRGEIKVRFDNHTTETFKLTNRAARNVGRDVKGADSRVIVYYTDEHGVKEVHYFRRK